MIDSAPSHAPRTTRQQELFDQLLTLFLDEGFAEFTMDAAASRLHCSKSTIYALAQSREDLVRLVLIEFFRRVSEQTEAALATGDTTAERLHNYLAAMAVALRPASAAFMRDAAVVPAAAAVYRRNTEIATAKITDLIVDGVRQGEFRPVPTEFIVALISAAMEKIQQVVTLGGVSGVDAYRELGGFILHGVSAEQ